MDKLAKVETALLKKRYASEDGEAEPGAHIAKFNIGDTVDVHVRITEGERERVQVFTGTVIARHGSGGRPNDTFTVRRIVQGEGVERVFPFHSPNVVKVARKREGVVRRAKLYYLRERVGKGTRIKGKEQVRTGGKGKGRKTEPKKTEKTGDTE